MNITERSSKADIIDAAIELTDSQSELITNLRQQQRSLIIALAVVATWSVIF